MLQALENTLLPRKADWVTEAKAVPYRVAATWQTSLLRAPREILGTDTRAGCHRGRRTGLRSELWASLHLDLSSFGR